MSRKERLVSPYLRRRCRSFAEALRDIAAQKGADGDRVRPANRRPDPTSPDHDTTDPPERGSPTEGKDD